MNDSLRKNYYGDGVLRSETVRYTPPQDHTMGEKSYLKYIGRYDKEKLILDNKKIGYQQAEMLAQAYDQGMTIRIISAYRNDFNFLLLQNKKTLVGDIVFHNKDKKFNSLRQVMGFVKADPDGFVNELWVLVFPSKQYVDQIAELINAIINDFSIHQVPRIAGVRTVASHFPDLENNIELWTDLTDFLCPFIQHGDVALIGNLEYIVPGLEEYNFISDNDYTYGGIDGIFGIKVMENIHTQTRIVLLGVKESYWGDASAQIVHALLNAGAVHILYGSKAATTVDTDDVHTVYAPTQFGLITKEGVYKSIAYQRNEIGRFIENLGVEKTTVAVTVPTVIGESFDQRNAIKRMGHTCMDCENGHIAKVISEFNSFITDERSNLTSVLFQRQFLPIHFITDYIYYGKEIIQEDIANLGLHAEENSEYSKKRKKSFEKIGNVFGAYALTFGIVNQGSRMNGISTISSRNISFKDEFISIKPLLDAGLGREALLNVSPRTDAGDYRTIPAAVHLMICQKHGYINAALSTLLQFKQENIERILNETERTRIEVLELKLCSQIGSKIKFSSLVNSLSQIGKIEVLKEIKQYGAVKRREAICLAQQGEIDIALDCIKKAYEIDNIEYEKTNDFFTHLVTLCSYPNNNHIDLGLISESLSNIRKDFFRRPVSSGIYQTNFDKGAVASLFLEASYYLSADDNQTLEKGIKILTLAHLYNLRIGGNECSEIYGEILVCTKNLRVKNLLAFAMRVDAKAQMSFQRWANSKFKILTRTAENLNNLFRASASERESEILNIINEPSSHKKNNRNF